jgi:hypothetical protein
MHVHKQNFLQDQLQISRQRRHICIPPSHANLIRRKANIKDNTGLPIGGD